MGEVGETVSVIQEGHLDELENGEEGELAKAKRGKNTGWRKWGQDTMLDRHPGMQLKKLVGGKIPCWNYTTTTLFGPLL